MTLAYFNNCTLMSTTTFRIGFYNSSRVYGILMCTTKDFPNLSNSTSLIFLLKSVSDTYILHLFLEESLAERRTRNIVWLFEFLFGSLEVEESS